MAIGENPGYSHLLDRVPKGESVFGRLSFDYHDYRVEPPKGSYDDEAGTEFTTKLSGLRGELYSEAAREAIALMESAFDKSGSKREYITPKTLGPFKRIAERFRDFQALDPSALSAAELIDAAVSQAMTFAQSDKNNRISDGPMMLVLAMAQTFANPAAAARLAEKSRNEGTASTFDHLMSMGSVNAVTEVQSEQPKAQAPVVKIEDEVHMQPFSSLQSMKQSISDANLIVVTGLTDLANANPSNVTDIEHVREVETPVADDQVAPVQKTGDISQLFLI